jgi:methyl-accepting chemotaxis protein
MDLEKAGQSHHEWKVKFRVAMKNQEKMDVVRIGSDSACDFGRWLHGEGRAQHGADPAFQECLTRHAQFHQEAARVAQAINDRRLAQAEAMLGTGTAYSSASYSTVAAIGQLKSVIQK